MPLIYNAMWSLEALAQNVLKLNEDAAFKQVINTPAIQIEAIRLNRDEQLYKRGVDAQGNKMRSIYARFGRVYADNTIAIKQAEGQPTDRVTMRNTGALYKTFQTKINGNELVLDVDTIKNGKDLQREWGQFVGLDEISKEILVDKSKPIVKQYLINTIL